MHNFRTSQRDGNFLRVIGSTKEVLSLERPGRASNQSSPKVTTAWVILCNRLIFYTREACWNMLKQRMCRRVRKDVDEGIYAGRMGKFGLENIHMRILEMSDHYAGTTLGNSMPRWKPESPEARKRKLLESRIYKFVSEFLPTITREHSPVAQYVVPCKSWLAKVFN